MSTLEIQNPGNYPSEWPDIIPIREWHNVMSRCYYSIIGLARKESEDENGAIYKTRVDANHKSISGGWLRIDGKMQLVEIVLFYSPGYPYPYVWKGIL